MADWKTEMRGDRVEMEKETYMVVVGANRVHGHTDLFDSEHKHHNYITLTIKQASRERRLSGDYIYGQEHLIKVAMSESQWATMISSLNMGSGVPATLQWMQGHGEVRPPPPQERTTLFREDLTDTLQDAVALLKELGESKLTRAQKSILDKAIQEITLNADFVEDRFDEHMEKRVEKAKADIQGYMTSAIQRVGIAALADPNVTRLLADKREEDPYDDKPR